MAKAPWQGNREYLAAVAEGVSLHNAGRYAEARASYARAHEIAPNARTLRGLGFAELALAEQERRWRVEAAQHLEQALASSAFRLEGELRAATDAELSKLKGELARLQVAVEPADAEASVRIAGKLVAQSEAAWLEPGPYEVEVQAPGFATARKRGALKQGELEQIDMRLVPLSTPAAAAVAPPPVARAPRAPRAPWYVIGGGAALTVTGVVLLAVAQGHQRDVDDAPDGAPWSRYADKPGQYKGLTASGSVLLGAGVAAVAGGAIWYAVARRRPRVDVALAPFGVQLGGRF